MKIITTSKDKTNIIWVLCGLLVISLLFNISEEVEDDKVSRMLHYGMVDGNINYTIIYDQVKNAKAVYAELFGDSDTIQVQNYIFVKTDSISEDGSILTRDLE